MNITTDETLIRSILEDPTVKEGFWPEPPRNIFYASALYFYYPGIGLFPATFTGTNIMMHAAIPKRNRGIKAVAAGKALVHALKEEGWNVYTKTYKAKKHIVRYIKMLGFTLVDETEDKLLYRYP